MATFTVGRHLGTIHSTCPENDRLYQKLGRATVRPKDLFVVRIKLHRIHIRTLTKLLSKLRPMPFSVLLQDHTMLFRPAYLVLVSCAALVLTWLVSILSASRLAIELPRVRTLSAKAFRRSRQPESMTLLLSLRSTPSGKRNCSLRPCSQHCGSVQCCMLPGPQWQT